MQKSLFRTSVLLMGFSLLNLVGSFLRDRTLSTVFGAGVKSDTLFVIMQIPIFFYTVLDCVFRSCVIPRVTLLRARHSQEDVSRLLQGFASLILLALAGITYLLLFFRGPVLRFLDPTWVGEGARVPEQIALLLWPSILVIGLVTFGMHVVNSYGSYYLASVVLLPRVLAICLVVLLLHETLGVASAALGFTLGVVAQLIPVTIGFFKHHIHIRVFRKEQWPEIRNFFRFMAAPALGITVVYLFYPQEGKISAYCEEGVMTHLFYARRVCQILSMMFTLSLGVVAHTRASEAWGKGERTEALGKMVEALRLGVLMLFPMTALALLGRVTFLNVVFGGGLFTYENVLRTADQQLLLFPAVVSLILVNLLMSFFLTAGKGILHALVNLLIFALTLGLQLLFVFPLGLRTVGIAGGWSLAGIVSLPVVVLCFQKWIAPLPLASLIHHSLRVLTASVLAAIPGLLLLWQVPHENRLVSLILLPILAGSYGLAFAGLAAILKLEGVNRILTRLPWPWRNSRNAG